MLELSRSPKMEGNKNQDPNRAQFDLRSKSGYLRSQTWPHTPRWGWTLVQCDGSRGYTFAEPEGF